MPEFAVTRSDLGIGRIWLVDLLGMDEQAGTCTGDWVRSVDSVQRALHSFASHDFRDLDEPEGLWWTVAPSEASACFRAGKPTRCR